MAIPLVASSPYTDPYGDLITGDSGNFTSSIGGWVAGGGAGTPTRDTTAQYLLVSLPASLKFVTTATGQYAELPISGVFKVGVEYQALLAVCIEESSPTPASVSPEITLGVQGTDSNGITGTFSSAYYFGSGKWYIALLRWVPSADRTGVKLRVKRVGTETGTMTWHVAYARALRLQPGTLGLGAVFEPGRNPYTIGSGGSDTVVVGRAGQNNGWRDAGLPGNGWYVGGVTSGIYSQTGSVTPGALSQGGENVTNERRGASLVIGDRGVNLETGPDFVGVMLNERSSTEVEIYPDYADYDVYLLDGSTNADTKHWWHEEADGTYKASAGRKSRVGLYFQTAFHVTGAQTTGTAKNEPGEYWQVPFPTEIDEVRVHLGTAPTGSSFIVDVNINGTSIFTTQGNRPTIAASGTDATSGAPDTTLFAKNDRLSIDVDQVGSTVAGSDLTVMVRGRYLW